MKLFFNLFRAAAVVFLLTQAVAPAHALNPVPTIPVCDTPSPTGAPIDGGASLLLASGAMYAVRRIRKARR